jgi:gamma-glutamyltranspeptidase/glutathione hydrolase
VHFENGVVYAEPGIEVQQPLAGDESLVRFGARNLFFGGVGAVRLKENRLSGAGDPRRGGVAVVV